MNTFTKNDFNIIETKELSIAVIKDSLKIPIFYHSPNFKKTLETCEELQRNYAKQASDVLSDISINYLILEFQWEQLTFLNKKRTCSRLINIICIDSKIKNPLSLSKLIPTLVYDKDLNTFKTNPHLSTNESIDEIVASIVSVSI